jgi:sterol desaturase/sphingolipid hydroxylase (fatty acid hydroxylase superfamily)
MKFNRLVWIIFVPLFLFFLALFYIEVSVYSLLPPDQGGMSFWTELKNVWYRSVSFYAMVMIVCFFLYVRFIHK